MIGCNSSNKSFDTEFSEATRHIGITIFIQQQDDGSWSKDVSALGAAVTKLNEVLKLSPYTDKYQFFINDVEELESTADYNMEKDDEGVWRLIEDSYKSDDLNLYVGQNFDPDFLIWHEENASGFFDSTRNYVALSSEYEDEDDFMAYVLIHEVGHYLGLDHIKDASNIMEPDRWNSEEWPPVFTETQYEDMGEKLDSLYEDGDLNMTDSPSPIDDNSHVTLGCGEEDDSESLSEAFSDVLNGGVIEIGEDIVIDELTFESYPNLTDVTIQGSSGTETITIVDSDGDGKTGFTMASGNTLKFKSVSLDCARLQIDEGALNLKDVSFSSEVQISVKNGAQMEIDGSTLKGSLYINETGTKVSLLNSDLQGEVHVRGAVFYSANSNLTTTETDILTALESAQIEIESTNLVGDLQITDSDTYVSLANSELEGSVDISAGSLYTDHSNLNGRNFAAYDAAQVELENSTLEGDLVLSDEGTTFKAKSSTIKADIDSSQASLVFSDTSYLEIQYEGINVNDGTVSFENSELITHEDSTFRDCEIQIEESNVYFGSTTNFTYVSTNVVNSDFDFEYMVLISSGLTFADSDVMTSYSDQPTIIQNVIDEVTATIASTNTTGWNHSLRLFVESELCEITLDENDFIYSTDERPDECE